MVFIYSFFKPKFEILHHGKVQLKIKVVTLLMEYYTKENTNLYN